MTHYQHVWRNGGPTTAGQAVENAVDFAGSERDGRMEAMQAEITALAGIVGRLLEALGALNLPPQKVAEIIGYSWEIAP